jgi:acyl-CoA thioester hydrolase
MNALTPTSGLMRGQAHFFPVRVYYEDTDAGGMVYHSNYLNFAERARTEMLRVAGIEQSTARETYGVMFVLHSGEVRYRRPARLDDALTVETILCDLGVASIHARQTIRKGDEEMATFNAKLACVGGDGKPTPMPEAWRVKFAAFVS